MSSGDHSGQTFCVAATFTADLLQETLEYWWETLGMETGVRIAPYGQVFQQLLDPGSELRRNRSGANAVLVRWADLGGGPSAEGREPCESELARELASTLEAAQLASPTALVLCPPRDRGSAFAEAEGLLRDRLARVPGLTVLGPADVESLYPVGDPHDPVSDRFGHVPFTPRWFVATGTALARWHHRVTSKPRKVIVLDCDNTLWGGVVGEDGPRGLRVDGPWEALQRTMAGQAEAGRLLCLCSKNEESDVLGVFEQRPEMPLALSHIVARRISWQPKSQAIQELAAELDLGLDSFVFIDDSPVECAEVRSACPEVLTLQLPGEPGRIGAFLQHAWPLDLGPVTDEDRHRTRTYQDNLQRAQLRQQAPSLAGFIERLDLRVELTPAGPADLPRLAQLTQRTNQFNASTLRLSEAELQERLHGDLSTSVMVKASDRFGDYGTVGLALGRADADELRIEVLLMSCRALGRGIEHRLLAHLGEAAASTGLGQVAVVFRPSPRNTPVRLFLERAFGRQAEPGGETVFRMAAAAASRVVFQPEVEPTDTPKEPSRAPSSDRGPMASSTVFQQVADRLNRVEAIEETLAARTRPRGDIEQGFVEPGPGAEREIAAIWREVLHLDRVGARDGFRELGGRSLHLVRIHRLLLERLKVDVDITTLFQHPTVASLAAHIETATDPALEGVSDRARRIRAGLARQAAARRTSGQRRI